VNNEIKLIRYNFEQAINRIEEIVNDRQSLTSLQKEKAIYYGRRALVVLYRMANYLREFGAADDRGRTFVMAGLVGGVGYKLTMACHLSNILWTWSHCNLEVDMLTGEIKVHVAGLHEDGKYVPYRKNIDLAELLKYRAEWDRTKDIKLNSKEHDEL
jgi:hypothetical protein